MVGAVELVNGRDHRHETNVGGHKPVIANDYHCTYRSLLVVGRLLVTYPLPSSRCRLTQRRNAVLTTVDKTVAHKGTALIHLLLVRIYFVFTENDQLPD